MFMPPLGRRSTDSGRKSRAEPLLLCGVHAAGGGNIHHQFARATKT